jgi:hypothetical protein
MAKIRRNSALRAIRGELDGFVYKTFKHGGGCIARKPGCNGANTERRQAVNERFRLANDYAHEVGQDPERRAFYEAFARKHKAWRTFNVIRGDFLNPPTITQVDLQAFRGQPGSWITIHAHDDVGVVSVQVEIRGVDGHVWESGTAGSDPMGGWRYTATQTIPRGTEVNIGIVAEDRPGNRTMQWRTVTLEKANEPRRGPNPQN